MHTKTIALCAAALVAALLVVGFVSNGIARHADATGQRAVTTGNEWNRGGVGFHIGVQPER